MIGTLERIGLVILLLVVFYVGGIIIKAYLDVKAAPREPMLLCEKHGPIRVKGTIDFFGSKFCGLCFHQRLRDAEKGKF